MIMHRSTRRYRPTSLSPEAPLADYINQLIDKGHHLFYSDMGRDSLFAKFTARLEKPRTINNLAGGHPANYRLVLESDKNVPLLRESPHSLAGQEFQSWFQEIEAKLRTYNGIELGDFTTNRHMSRITLSLSTDSTATIDALDSICERCASRSR